MRSVVRSLEAAGLTILESGSTICRAEFVANEMVKCEVNVSRQDVRGWKIFSSGHMLIKEIVGNETYWTGIGREIGPNGLFPANSHLAEGWPVEDEDKAIVGISGVLLDWLRTTSSPSRLIEAIETSYFEGDKIPAPTAKTGLAKAFLEDIGITRRSSEKFETVFHEGYAKHLANLHLWLGNSKRCLFFVEKWIAHRGLKNVDPAYLSLRDKLLEV